VLVLVVVYAACIHAGGVVHVVYYGMRYVVLLVVHHIARDVHTVCVPTARGRCKSIY